MSDSDCAPALLAKSTPNRAGAEFFSAYEWCLNPLQPLSALCTQAQEELRRYETLGSPWQREEVRRNLYLLLCAACCAVDDYLAQHLYDLSPVARRLPGIARAVHAMESAANVIAVLRRAAGDSFALRLRGTLARCIDRICDVLLAGDEENAAAWSSLSATMTIVSCAGAPPELLGWVARIPEAFRCQDMSHYDAIAMAERFLGEAGDDHRAVLVVGLRTAGAYFAPLVNAVLAARGFATAGWMTIRPRVGLSQQEKRPLLRAVAAGSRVLVVDDHPNTGGTFARTLAIFSALGLASDKVAILAPEHPAQVDWARATGDSQLITLPFADLYKQRVLRSDAAITRLLRDLYGAEDIALHASPQVDRLNAALAAELGSTFEVRLKRVYQVQFRRDGMPPVKRLVLAKSVGWGWLGYHAVIAGSRLADFVPHVVGFRDGLLFSEWIGSADMPIPAPDPAQIIPIVGKYIAARVNRLRLDADPNRAVSGGRPAGWDTLSRIIRRPYGRVIGRLGAVRLRARLARYHAPLPALVDGAMAADEWAMSESGVAKIDFEHHNFAGAQQDVVDGCYDLASAVRDLGMNAAEEAALLADYVRETGDHTAGERLPLYKLLCGVAEMRRAAYCIVRTSPRERQEAWNRRYNRARDFLNVQLARHCARNLRPAPPAWSSKLFLLDLDGVLDAELLSPLFQHTTPAGIAALSLLSEGGYSVVLNTARSLQQVKSYCTIYALPGGIAEYGSVFFDAVAGSEIPLVDAQALAQLADCRARLERMEGIFVDPGYRYSLRAYRYRGDLTVGLSIPELQHVLDGFDRLGFLARDADSHILQRGVDKGSGASFVKNRLARFRPPVIAIGDAEPDLRMFAEADIAYVPANFDPAHRNALRGSKYRMLQQARQRALLAAARDLTGRTSYTPAQDKAASPHLLDHVLHMADQPRHRRLLDLLMR